MGATDRNPGTFHWLCPGNGVVVMTLVLLAFGYMMYLAPGCRHRALMVLSSAFVIGCGVWAAIYWLTGSFGLGIKALLAQKPTLGALVSLTFALSRWTDGYLLVFLFHCGPYRIRKLAEGVVFRQHCPAAYQLNRVLLFSLARPFVSGTQL